LTGLYNKRKPINKYKGISRSEKAGEEWGSKSLDLSLHNKITFMLRFNELVIPLKREGNAVILHIPWIFGTRHTCLPRQDWKGGVGVCVRAHICPV